MACGPGRCPLRLWMIGRRRSPPGCCDPATDAIGEAFELLSLHGQQGSGAAPGGLRLSTSAAATDRCWQFPRLHLPPIVELARQMRSRAYRSRTPQVGPARSRLWSDRPTARERDPGGQAQSDRLLGLDPTAASALAMSSEPRSPAEGHVDARDVLAVGIVEFGLGHRRVRELGLPVHGLEAPARWWPASTSARKTPNLGPPR